MKHRNGLVNKQLQTTKKLFMDAFDVERQRSLLALAHKYKKLRFMYSGNLPKLENINTGKFWNEHLLRNELLKSPIYSDKLRIITKFLVHKCGDLLDIGFGMASVEKELDKKDLGLKFWGVDISKDAVALAQKTIEGKFSKGKASKLPYASTFFDYVLVLDTLEHISPSEVFCVYREIKRVMKTHSVLIVSVPLNEGLDVMISNGINPNGHVRIYTPELIKAELTITGFKIFREEYLYAFKKFYLIKNFLIRFMPKFRRPNLIIVFAKK